MSISEISNYKLKKEDIELLKRLDRVETQEELRHLLGRKPTPGELEYREMEKLINFGKADTLQNLLTKYAYWKPIFQKDTRIFVFNSAVPVEVLYVFRLDARKFLYSNIIVNGPNPRAGYEKWKQ